MVQYCLGLYRSCVVQYSTYTHTHTHTHNANSTCICQVIFASLCVCVCVCVSESVCIYIQCKQYTYMLVKLVSFCLWTIPLGVSHVITVVQIYIKLVKFDIKLVQSYMKQVTFYLSYFAMKKDSFYENLKLMTLTFDLDLILVLRGH